jgi:hypothetical protein
MKASGFARLQPLAKKSTKLAHARSRLTPWVLQAHSRPLQAHSRPLQASLTRAPTSPSPAQASGACSACPPARPNLTRMLQARGPATLQDGEVPPRPRTVENEAVVEPDTDPTHRTTLRAAMIREVARCKQGPCEREPVDGDQDGCRCARSAFAFAGHEGRVTTRWCKATGPLVRNERTGLRCGLRVEGDRCEDSVMRVASCSRLLQGRNRMRASREMRSSRRSPNSSHVCALGSLLSYVVVQMLFRESVGCWCAVVIVLDVGCSPPPASTAPRFSVSDCPSASSCAPSVATTTPLFGSLRSRISRQGPACGGLRHPSRS